jgi:hypothetical protein
MKSIYYTALGFVLLIIFYAIGYIIDRWAQKKFKSNFDSWKEF